MLFNDKINESLTLKFAEAARQRHIDGKEIISLGLGEPDFDVPKELINSVIDVLKNERSGYSSPMGIQNLKEKIAHKLQIENYIPATANNILITPGAKQAFQLALMVLLQPYDEVVVINPSFVSFIPQVYIAEPTAVVNIINVNKSDFSIPLDELEQKLNDKTKVVILNSPNNPAGYTLTQNEINEVYRLAGKYNFYIISDEIYEKLMFPGQSHISLGSVESKVDRVFTINGYSKSHAMTGWRLGYLCFPDAFFIKLLKLQQHINTNTCTFIQKGMLNAFDMDMSFLINYNKILQNRASKVNDLVNEVDGFSLVPPKAGFFAFIDISSIGLDSNTFCGKLIEETGVATTPGLAFGDNWDGYFRLSYAVNEEVLEDGLIRIKDFINSNYY